MLRIILKINENWPVLVSVLFGIHWELMCCMQYRPLHLFLNFVVFVLKIYNNGPFLVIVKSGVHGKIMCCMQWIGDCCHCFYCRDLFENVYIRKNYLDQYILNSILIYCNTSLRHRSIFGYFYSIYSGNYWYHGVGFTVAFLIWLTNNVNCSKIIKRI